MTSSVSIGKDRPVACCTTDSLTSGTSPGSRSCEIIDNNGLVDNIGSRTVGAHR